MHLRISHEIQVHLSINVGHLPSQHHSHHFTLHPHALERSPLRLRELHVLRDDPLLLQIHLENILCYTQIYLNNRFSRTTKHSGIQILSFL